MYFVELQRSRRVLFWFVLVLAAGFALGAISLWASHGGIHVDEVPRIPISALLAMSTLSAWVIATCVAPGLSAEGATIAIAWTRPQPRAATAWRYVGIDLATILIAYVVQLVVALAFMASVGAFGWLFIDPLVSDVIVLGLGCTLMWYGLVTVAAARFPRRGGLIAGLSWAVFLLAASLIAAPLPALIHGLIVGLDFLNPIAYFSGFSLGSGGEQVRHLANLSGNTRTILAWSIGALAVVANVRLWSTREA